MKRRKVFLCWTAIQTGICFASFMLTVLWAGKADAAIMPPPWSDPEKNPCASMPGGWQLLYWPPLKKCFKIFTIGYPCPETMELSPTAVSGSKKKNNVGNTAAAECRCPPGTALSAETGKCHRIFERGPCEKEQFFSPLPESKIGLKRLENRWGTCKTPRKCPDNMLFWPMDGKCYIKFTKGPCPKGKLLVLNEEDGLAECKCENTGELSAYYYELEETCHEHYTKGPCSTPGHLFLPGGHCDCFSHLPHYHDPHNMCYELNTPGPCPPGHIFNLPENMTSSESPAYPRATCQCKEGYVPWRDGFCYRLYTRGPCGPNEFLINATTCIRNFCGKSRLYFPDQKSCYRIGSQGPCALHQVVVFDFTARPSLDGIAYNGMCGCSGVIMNLDQQCSSNEQEAAEMNTCESTPGMVELNGNCYKLYTRGPCGPGQWLEPLKTQVTNGQRGFGTNKAKCVCRPGYTRAEPKEGEGESELMGKKLVVNGVHRCNAPSVGLARYLTNHQRQNSKFAYTFNFQNFQYLN